MRRPTFVTPILCSTMISFLQVKSIAISGRSDHCYRILCLLPQHHQQHLRRRSASLKSTTSRGNSDDDSYDYDDHDHLVDGKTNVLLSSLKSNTVKRIQSLLTKSRKRLEFGQAVVEGPRIIFDLLQNEKTRHLVQHVLVRSDQLESYQQLQSWTMDQKRQQEQEQEQHQQMQDNQQFVSTSNHYPRIQLGTPQVLQACSDTVTPQGMVAIVNIPKFNCDPQHGNSNRMGDCQDDLSSLPSLLSSILERQQQTGGTPSVHNQQQALLFLILDGLSDPGNVGTLLRTCVAVGVSAVLLLPNCCDPFSPKALRSAMGATFQLPIVPYESWTDCFQQLQACARTLDSWDDSKQPQGQTAGANLNANAYSHSTEQPNIWAATMMLENDRQDNNDNNILLSSDIHNNDNAMPQPTSLAYYQIDWTAESLTSSDSTAVTCKIIALVIGGEGNGLSPPIRQALSDGSIRAVHVPMNTGIESLNAAVCGSVILFETLRQRQQQRQHPNGKNHPL